MIVYRSNSPKYAASNDEKSYKAYITYSDDLFALSYIHDNGDISMFTVVDISLGCLFDRSSLSLSVTKARKMFYYTW